MNNTASKKKIGIWGLGQEGNAVLNHLSKIKTNDDIYILSQEKISSEKYSNIYGSDATEKISSGYFDVIYKSPGISLYNPEIKQAQENGTQFSSATNLWFEQNTQTKKIIVTGTKGKSTTASLLYHIINQIGYSVSLAGNIGIPALSLKEQTEFTILELSSYQLADLQHEPDYFLTLNLFPEHLQWHQTHENYYRDKLSPIFKSQKKCKIIANAKNSRLKDYIKESKKDAIWFNTKSNFYVDQNSLYQNEKKLELITNLKGTHNLENIAAVLTFCDLLKIDISKCINAITDFQSLPHRLQEFTSSDGNLCVNDSISTTPETTLAAMRVYKDKPLHLILGGTDRGQNYDELIKFFKEFDIKSIALLPKNGSKIDALIQKAHSNISLHLAENLEEATTYAKQKANNGDIILLSPGAPSYSQFKNFEERGDLFMKLLRS